MLFHFDRRKKSEKEKKPPRFLVLRRKWLTLGAAVLAAAAIFAAVNYPAAVSASAATRQLPIYCVQRDQKVCSISFDAAWGADNTQKIRDVLKEYGDSLGVEIIPTSDSKAAALKSQLIVGETTAPKPFMDTSWLTPGCGLVSMHSNEVMEDVFLKADGIVADYWTQLKQHTNPLSKLTKEGKLDESQIMDLSELVLGTKKLRTSDDQFVAAASMGLGALDIMIAYQLYLNATEMGIGTKVNLWDKPLWE